MRKEREEALDRFLREQTKAQVAFIQSLLLADRLQTRREALHADIQKVLWPEGRKDPDDIGRSTEASDEMIEANMRLYTLINTLDAHWKTVRIKETRYAPHEERRRAPLYEKAVEENNPSAVSPGWKIFSDISKDFGISLTVGQDDIDGFFVDVDCFPPTSTPGASS